MHRGADGSRAPVASSLAQQAAPPQPKPGAGGCLVVSMFCLLLFGVLILLSAFDASHGGPDAGLLTTGGIMMILGLILFASMRTTNRAAEEYNRTTYPRLKEQWERTWLCLRCGNRFEASERFEFNALSTMLQVTKVGEEHAVCQFTRENWVAWDGNGVPPPGTDLGGMSGGPVLLVGRLDYPLVALVSEFNPTFELLYLRPPIPLTGQTVDLRWCPSAGEASNSSLACQTASTSARGTPVNARSTAAIMGRSASPRRLSVDRPVARASRVAGTGAPRGAPTSRLTSAPVGHSEL